MTITEFLLARIADDEAGARRCAEAYPSPWYVSDRGHTATVKADAPDFRIVTELEQSERIDGWLSERLDHIARHDPARVLAECQAKRAIIESVAALTGDREKSYLERLAHTEVEDARYGVTRDILLLLAAVYADHPDYDPSWRP